MSDQACEYDPKDPSTERRHVHWSLDKKIPLALIVSMFVLMGTQLVVYGENKQQNKNRDVQYVSLHAEVKSLAKGNASRQMVTDMLAARDSQIQSLKGDLRDIKGSVGANNEILQKILLELPRK